MLRVPTHPGTHRIISPYYGNSVRYFSLQIPNLDLFTRATSFNQKTAIIDHQTGKKFTYSDLLSHSQDLHKKLTTNATGDLKEQRVAVLCQAGFDYVQSQWAVWRAGGVFVPLCTTHPEAELEYVLKDSEVSKAIVDPHFESILKPITDRLKIDLHTLDQPKPLKESNVNSTTFSFDKERNAMIIYTSGTTGRPKGVVSTHNNIEAQIKTMIEPWKWTSGDHVLHVLPLHHVHGVINVKRRRFE
eukprot:TRINITY_DN7035_c0_g1_i4.p1 TRINITY_DN7035_c0_g1~~TRINITY_DN7035_c0_g1_i4.p1  ORF type:complete len:244 (+),score=56.51 TRINITY_DN7035_c0_g1_i4:86-817(+)